MKTLDILRDSLETDFFGAAELQSVLGPSESRYSALSRLLRSGDVMRLRRGFYAFGSKYRKSQLTPFSIANILYGPSYVSLETMLSFYGLIPEQVMEVSSVNTKKTKLYHTPIGRFRYRMIPQTAFSYGVCTQSSNSTLFIAATKEKAVLDTLYLARAKRPFSYLTESLRIEHKELKEIDSNDLLKLARTYSNNAFLKRIEKLIEELCKT